MADTTLSIGVSADISELRAELAKIPGVSEQEARDMVTGLRKQFQAAEKAAKDSAKATAKAAKDASDAQVAAADKAAKEAEKAAARMAADQKAAYTKISSAAGALSAQIGGEFGQMGSIFNSTIRPLTEVGTEFGVAGAAAAELGLAVAAVYGVVNGALDLADAASSAATELQTMGYSVDADAQQDLARYTEGTNDLKIAFDQLKVAAGAPVASEIGVLSRALSDDLQPSVLDQARAWNQWGDDLVSKNLPAVAAVRDAIRGGEYSLYSALTDTARAEVDAEAKLDGYNDGLSVTKQLIADIVGDYGPSLEQLLGKGGSPNKATQDAASAAKAAAAEATEEAKQTRAAMLAQNEAAQSATKALVEQRVEVATSRRYWENLTKTVAASADAAKTAIDKVSDEIKKKYIDALETAQADTYASLVPGILDSIGAIDQATIDSYQNQIAAGKELTTAQIEAGNRAIRGQELVSIAQAGISATLAGIGTYAALTTELVPPPAAAITAGAVSSLSFAAAVAGIEAHKPAFFTFPHTSFAPAYAADGTAQDLVDTNGDGKPDTAGAVASKGGHVDDAESRSRRDGGRVVVDRRGRFVYTDGANGKAPRRGGHR